MLMRIQCLNYYSYYNSIIQHTVGFVAYTRSVLLWIKHPSCYDIIYVIVCEISGVVQLSCLMCCYVELLSSQSIDYYAHTQLYGDQSMDDHRWPTHVPSRFDTHIILSLNMAFNLTPRFLNCFVVIMIEFMYVYSYVDTFIFLKVQL